IHVKILEAIRLIAVAVHPPVDNTDDPRLAAPDRRTNRAPLTIRLVDDLRVDHRAGEVELGLRTVVASISDSCSDRIERRSREGYRRVDSKQCYKTRIAGAH